MKRKMRGIALVLGLALLGSNAQAITIDTKVIESFISKENQEATMNAEEAKVLLEATLGRPITNEKLLSLQKEGLTRGTFTQMLVDALRYEDLAKKLELRPSSFIDVKTNKGTIQLVKELGLMKGYEDQTFRPDQVMTKQEVISVLKAMEQKLQPPIQGIHSHYAIQSNSQMELIKNCTQVSFGWAEVRYDEKQGIVVATKNNPSGFNKPTGFEEPLNFSKANGVETYIMFYLEDKALTQGPLAGKNLAKSLFEESTARQAVIENIVQQAKDFDGVTIDFENFRSSDLKLGFNTFLGELKAALVAQQKKLNVAVPPNLYYKGYDYKTIGSLADHVILMAHDYEAKSLTKEEMLSGFTITPITPLSSVYETLKEITHPETGITDTSKIMLQFSFGSSQWQVQDNVILNQRPYNPTYDKIFNRLQKEGTESFYSEIYHNPYATYWDGTTKNVIWYENSESIQAKIDLAKLLGINSISLWRLGIIPDYQGTTSQEIDLDVVSSLKLN